MKSITEYFNTKINEATYNIFDEEADKDGKIKLTTSEFSHGGRESNEVEWEIELLDDVDYAWFVRATVVKTDIPRKFKKGWYLDFDLDKKTEIDDLQYDLKQAIENDREGAWSSGH